MDFPIGSGDSALGAFAIADRFRAVLRRLQGRGAYYEIAGGVRETELLAAGTACAIGAQVIDKAWKNSIAGQADQLLEEWEHLLLVPNDAARADDERRTRLSALMRIGSSTPWERAQHILRRLAPSATLHANTYEMGYKEGVELAEWFDVHHVGVTFVPLVSLDDVDFDDPARRRFVEHIMRRMLPARALRPLCSHDVRDAVATGYGAQLASMDTYLDRDAIGQQTAIERIPEAVYFLGPPARVVPYGPLSPLRSEDLHLIQDATLITPATSNLVEYNTSDAQSVLLAFAASIAAGAAAEIDVSGNWTERLLTIEGTYSTSDLRPGQPSDSVINGGGTPFRVYWYTKGGGEAGYEYNVDANIRFWVDGVSKALKIRNLSGSTQYIAGVVLGTGKVNSPGGGGATTRRRIRSFAEGERADLNFNRTFLDALQKTAFLVPDGAGADVWGDCPGRGGVQRLACVVNFPKAAPAATVVLDATTDWRDRLLAVWWSFKDVVFANESNFPGAPTDNAWTSSATTNRIGYTRHGGASGNGTLTLNYHIELEVGMRLYARDSDGALCLDLDNDYVSEGSSVLIRIWASNLTGERQVLGAHPALFTADLDEVAPFDLNALQDPVVLDQVRGNPTVVSGAYPLGPVLRRGLPAVPAVWTVRGVERRQPCEQSRRLWFALQVANNTTVAIDDSVDWRDRVLHGMGRRSANDIRPGRANDADFDAATAWAGAEYLGVGQLTGAIASPGYYIMLTAGLGIFASSANGVLNIRNETGATVYVVGTLEGSFRLGPRRVD